MERAGGEATKNRNNDPKNEPRIPNDAFLEFSASSHTCPVWGFPISTLTVGHKNKKALNITPQLSLLLICLFAYACTSPLPLKGSIIVDHKKCLLVFESSKKSHLLCFFFIIIFIFTLRVWFSRSERVACCFQTEAQQQVRVAFKKSIRKKVVCILNSFSVRARQRFSFESCSERDIFSREKESIC